MTTTEARMLQRRATSAEWTAENPILSPGEFGWDTTVKRMKIGDGATTWVDLDWLFPDITLPFYIPEDYGAVGDGVADDKVALQQAYDAAFNAGGGMVLLTGRYGWTGDLVHRGAITVRGVAVAKVLATDDEMDRGLVALNGTSRYRYGLWGGGSVDDNPGGLYDLVIDGRDVGGITDGLFIMQCVDGLVQNVRVTHSAGDCVMVDGAQNSTIDACLFGYAGGSAMHFGRIGDAGQGAGNIKVNGTYLATSAMLLRATSDPTNFYAHDIFFDTCLLENYQEGGDLVQIDAGDFQFTRCVFTNSNDGDPAPPNDCVVQIRQLDLPTIATTVTFDSCYFNGGSAGVTHLVKIPHVSGGVGNYVRFYGKQHFTNGDFVVGMLGGGAFSSIVAIDGFVDRLAGALEWWDTTGGGWLHRCFLSTSTPTQYAIPDDPTGTLPPAVAFRRENDTQDRHRVDRDGTHFWLDGSAVNIRGSITRSSVDNGMELGGLWRVQNAIAHRFILLATVTAPGTAVALSGAATASPVQAVRFAADGASADFSISGGVTGSFLEVQMDATALSLGQSASVTYPASMITAASALPQPVQGKVVVAGFRFNGTAWVEMYRNTSGSGGSGDYVPTSRTLAGLDLTADRSASALKAALAITEGDVSGLTADLAGKAPLASPAFTGNPTAPTPTAGDNDTSVATTAFVTAAIAAAGAGGGAPKFGTTATAIGTAAKTATISGYTPAANDVLFLTLTSGNTATNPTLDINGGGAKAIKLAGQAVAVEDAFSAAGAVWQMVYDGTAWNLTGVQTIAILATATQMRAGTSTTVAWMTPALVAAAIATLNLNTQTAAYTLALTDAGKCVQINTAGAAAVTIPTNATVGFPVGTVIEVRQIGAGATSVSGAAGVTLHPTTATARAQWSTIRLHKIATDEWVADGDFV